MAKRALVSAPEMNTDSYRAEFADYNSSLVLTRYRQRTFAETDAKPDIIIARLRDSHSDLFSRNALADLQAQIDSSPPEFETEVSGLRVLLSAARLEHVAAQTSEASSELTACESSLHLEWQGQTVALENVSTALAGEAEKVGRDQLFHRWLDAVSTCDDLRLTRLSHLHEAARTLEFDSYGELIAEATQTNFSQVQSDSEELLKETESTHRWAMTRVVARELPAVAAADLNVADLAYLSRLPWLDKFFTAHNWPKIYAETMNGLGIRVDKQPNLQIVFASAASQSRDSSCFSIKPPDDVRMVFSPHSRAHDFAGNLHAAGQAQQQAWSSKNLARRHPEFSYAPDRATNLSWGYLFSLLLLDSQWLQQSFPPLSQAQAGELTRDQAAILTLRIRRLIAETSYAILLHSGRSSSSEGLQAAFAELHDHATGFHFRPELFLLNLHERIDSAAQLRALAFATGLREYLRVRYGNRWWAARKAGDELIDLWNTSSRYSVAELARLVGFEISFALIAELLQTTMNGAKQ